MNRYRMLMGIVVFGTIWGLLECLIGGVPKGTGAMAHFPTGAFLAGFVGVGLMAGTRRIYGVPGMQVGMALVASVLRYFAPIGTVVICSALAIAAEGIVFEIILLAPSLNLAKMRKPVPLMSLGVIIGYSVYVTGYLFTQITTPIASGEAFVMADFISVLPLGLGRGFFAAVAAGVALPIAVRVKNLHFDVDRIAREHYYPTSTIVTAFCWAAFVLIFL